MNTGIAAALEPVGEGVIALEKVQIDATLNGLLSETVVSQTYRNLEPINIEAVYTFPLPLNAVLLELSLELNGKTLEGVVQGRSEAEEKYEDAIDEGDSAVLLQKLEPGMFTLNVGNIQSNETAVVRIKYAQLHQWQGNRLRLHIPTVIAPRYGDPAALGMAAHQIPEYSITANNGFELTVSIEGDLARADIECPSHPVGIFTNDGAKRIRLSGGHALMDRDFVLLITEPTRSSGHGLWAPDGDAYALLASFHPDIPDDAPLSPKNINLVVDCSGSMGGDSIAQARVALQEILTLLKPHDFFNIIAFGTHTDLLFKESVLANELNITSAQHYVRQLKANLGGTEFGGALDAAYHCGSPAGLPSDVLLITDGEVWNADDTISRARQSGQRIFTVGVGSAVSEVFVRGIADRTGGACELVSPLENMAEKIVRHFKRINQPGATTVKVVWPCPVAMQSPGTIDTVYAGDTLHVFGWVDQVPSGEISLRLTLEDGRTVEQQVSLQPQQSERAPSPTNLPRVAAHSRIDSLNESEAQDLAVKYQLVTHLTSCVLVHVRSDEQKADSIPALRKVPQTLAAGWGGMGRVMMNSLSDDRCDRLAAPRGSRGQSLPEICDFADNSEIAYSLSGPNEMPFDSSHGLDELIANINARYPENSAAKLDIETLDRLLDLGLESDTHKKLRAMISEQITEREVVMTFLFVLSLSHQSIAFSRHTRRAIRMAEKTSKIVHSLIDQIGEILASLKKRRFKMKLTRDIGNQPISGIYLQMSSWCAPKLVLKRRAGLCRDRYDVSRPWDKIDIIRELVPLLETEYDDFLEKFEKVDQKHYNTNSHRSRRYISRD